jgi:hypothetical protein
MYAYGVITGGDFMLRPGASLLLADLEAGDFDLLKLKFAAPSLPSALQLRSGIYRTMVGKPVLLLITCYYNKTSLFIYVILRIQTRITPIVSACYAP